MQAARIIQVPLETERISIFPSPEGSARTDVPRFQIRPYQIEDIDGIYAAADESREHIGKWMGWLTSDYTRDHAAAWVELSMGDWERGDSYEHVIVDSTDGTIVGACGLNGVGHKDLVCNLGYWVRSSRLGQGAARQAVRLLRDFGFQTLGFNRLEIVVADGNDHSRRVAMSAGAIYEGLQRMRIRIGMRPCDAHMYALLNPAAAEQLWKERSKTKATAEIPPPVM